MKVIELLLYCESFVAFSKNFNKTFTNKLFSKAFQIFFKSVNEHGIKIPVVIFVLMQIYGSVISIGMLFLFKKTLFQTK